MKIPFFIITFFALTIDSFHITLPERFTDGCFKATVGSLLLATSVYSAGETLADCGHGYHDLKKVYIGPIPKLVETF